MTPTNDYLSNDAAIILLGHGSPVSKANKTFLRIVQGVKEKGGYKYVQPAFLEFENPNFQEAVDILLDKGIKKIIVHPYFLYMGNHMRKDLPHEVDCAIKKDPCLKIFLAANLGYHEKLIEVAIEKIEAARKQYSIGGMQEVPYAKLKQHPIEAESFRIIGEQIDESMFTSQELPVVKRVIHATADFEFAQTLLFSKDAIDTAIRSIRKGKELFTDVRMVEAGINKTLLQGFGGSIKCFSRDTDVAKIAEEENITRATASVRKAAPSIDGCIVVIGNAPTALFELLRLINAGKAKPAVIVGVPVGFVGASESKNQLIDKKNCYITCKGRKGGSAVAVAIINALLLIAHDESKQGTS